MFSLTAIGGIGRRFANLICKKAEVDPDKRAGELTQDEVEKLVAIIQNPKQFKVGVWQSWCCLAWIVRSYDPCICHQHTVSQMSPSVITPCFLRSRRGS